MPDLLPPTKDFKYLIRPDGTIRVRTKAQIRPAEDDFVYTSPTKYEPRKHFWDFTTEQMLSYSPAQQTARRDAAKDAVDQVEAAKIAKVLRIKELTAQVQDADQREMWETLGELLGFDFGP